MAGAHEMILRLPDGMAPARGAGHRIVGRTATADRSGAGPVRPSVLVLDEPNANLDADGENALVMRSKFCATSRASSRLRTGYAFLVGRAPAIGLDGPETSLTKRLTRAFEGELKIGLRVLTIGVGIVGCWACLVPLSGAVVVPGTLVVESDLKKIQHPAGGVVANIPVRDGMHVSAGDVLLRLDETQLRTNAQVLAQQLDQTRVRTTPQLEGLVSYVSADLNHDRQKNPKPGLTTRFA